MNRDALERLSKDELIDLVLRLQRPEKTSSTSSQPPARDAKERREQAKPGGAKPGHEGHSRRLAESPDETVEHRPHVCPHCNTAFDGNLAVEVTGEYDSIDLPPLKPVVTRHQRMAVRCPHCRARVKAALPEAASGTPFGPQLHGLAVYLKTFQALSYQRLTGLFGDVFGLKLSAGGLMNMLKRASGAFRPQADAARAALRLAPSVACDETGVGIEGSNAWHWVFVSRDAVVHRPAMSRAAAVIRDEMDGHKPRLWLSDRYSAQQGHAHAQQTCLAHLARDIAYGLQASEDRLPLRLKLWLGEVFALARDIGSFAPATRTAKRRKLEGALDAIVKTPAPACEIARKLQAKIARARDQLLTFCDDPGAVEVTNNACERALRPAVIQRKITNGYRAFWAAEAEACVRTATSTARLKGHGIFQTITATLA